MSAFFLAINLDSKPFKPQLAEKMSRQLSRYGRDGHELVIRENYSMAYHRDWSVPEEVGERQPLYDAKLDVWLLFHGRIDNRDELVRKLTIKPDANCSDARLILALYQEFNDKFFAELIGPFVFVLFSPKRRSVIATRDCMGGRYLVFSKTAKCLLIATYEMALAAHPSVGYKINEAKAVKLLTGAMDGQPQSLINDVEPLLPGHILELEDSSHHVKPFYLPDPKRRIDSLSEVEYAQEFRRLLDIAVKRRLRSIGAVGTMLSGGLDSIPISILAAEELGGAGQRLSAYSWVFDQFADVDERRYSKPVCDQFNISPNWIACDEVWPQFDSEMARNPIVPFSTPYTALQQRLLATAGQQGVTTLLSGLGGDMLYTGTDGSGIELLRKAKFSQGLRELAQGWKDSRSIKAFVRRQLLPGIRMRSEIKAYRPEWLSQQGAAALKDEESWLSSQQKIARRPQQYFNAIGSLEGEDASYGRYLEAEYGVERRYPFRDRELVEFMLQIPGEQLRLNGVPRPIVRRAFTGAFPSNLYHRKDKTNFAPFVDAGIQSDENYQRWLHKENPAWHRYVKNSHRSKKGRAISLEPALQWRLAYYEWWNAVCYTANANELGF